MNYSAQETDSHFKFLANAMHEIRTPLQTILGSAELLSATTLDAEQKEYVRQIQFSSEVLLSLANDMLDVSKLRSDNFILEDLSFNVLNLLEQVTDLIAIEAYSKKIEVSTCYDYTVPLWIRGDPTRIQQIILNLAKNAVKFTHEGYVSICVRKGSLNGTEKIVFEITDSGIGIPKEKRNKIFEDYYQTEASITRKYGGTGLGLSICKHLVRKMAGIIQVDENPDGGSIFRVALPLIPAEVPELPPYHCDQDVNHLKTWPDPIIYQNNVRVLIVDDSPFAQKSIARKLCFFGCKHISTALSAQECLAKMHAAAEQNNPFTLVLIDMLMPKIDGWHLAAYINNDKTINGANLYLIIPQGNMGGEAKMKHLSWFNGYLYKPLKHEAVYQMLCEYNDQPLDLISAQPISEPDCMQTQQIESQSPTLIAEDNPLNQKLIQTFLQKLDLTVYCAGDGNEVIDIITEHPEIGIIFMDIRMPNCNGIDATKRLRAQGYTGVIIACTANNDTGDFTEYMQAGMNDILIKPFKKASIEELVKKWQNPIQQQTAK